jgi:hypothetical protein
LHPDGKEWVDTGLTANSNVRIGQPKVIKSIVTGNEIHFVPELAAPAAINH